MTLDTITTARDLLDDVLDEQLNRIAEAAFEHVPARKDSIEHADIVDERMIAVNDMLKITADTLIAEWKAGV